MITVASLNMPPVRILFSCQVRLEQAKQPADRSARGGRGSDAHLAQMDSHCDGGRDWPFLGQPQHCGKGAGVAAAGQAEFLT